MRLVRLFTLLAFVSCCASFASAQHSAIEKFKHTYVKKKNIKETVTSPDRADIPLATPVLTGVAPSAPAVSFREGAAFSVPLGSSYNVFSVVINQSDPLNYSPEINSLVFTHRQNYPHPGGSGIISFDVSTDGGATWDTLTKQVTPTLMADENTPINGNRYPNGAIYNPPGNTNPTNAYFVGTGPALYVNPDAGGNGWGYEYVASSKFDGSEVNEAYYSTADSNIYISGGMFTNTDGSIWYGNYRRNAYVDNQLWNPALVIKLVFNSATNSFDRSVIELPLNYTNSIDSVIVDPRIAFGPDGQVGYFVVRGVDGDDDEIYPSYKPIVWKTEDGGDTWIKQPRIHYQLLDSLIAYTIPIDGDGDGSSDSLAQGSPQVPFMSQYDMTVDANGQLHLIGSMLSSSDTAAAQFGFVWVGVGTVELFHFIYDGESDWRAIRASDWYNEDGAVGAATVDERLQASRSEDGEFIFFTWCKSFYELIEDGNTNDFPDIYGYAYSLEADTVAGPRNFGLEPGTEWTDFEFTDAATVGYFHMLSPISITGGEFWDLELPIVYGRPRDVTNDLMPIDYYFLRSAGFDYEDFGIVGTKETVQPEFFNLAVQPNPASNEALASFELDNNALYSLSLLNIMGQKVQDIETARGLATNQVRVNVNGLEPGMYLLRLQAENKVAVAKLMVR